MKNLTDLEFNKQIVNFWENMKSVGLDEHYNLESLSSMFRKAAAGTNEDSGLAYPGALLVHINLVTAIAKKLASMISGTFNIDDNSLTKVCLLQHMSKSAMFELNDNEWEIKNRGMNYKFSNLEGRLKAGERSIMYAMRCGITFSPIEYEAMVCLDRDNESKGANIFDSPLTTVIRQANELATMIERERNKQ